MFQRLISIWDNTSFHLNRTVYYVCFSAAGLFVLSYFIPVLFNIAIILLLFAGITVFVEFILLYRRKDGIEAHRIIEDRLSNGDRNKVVIEIKNNYDFKIFCTVIDELPYQLQERKWNRIVNPEANAQESISYYVEPMERG